MCPKLPPRAAALAVLAFALFGGWAVGRSEPPAPGRMSLTPQEVAARLDRAGMDPVALLEVAAVADVKAAVRIRRRVKELLQERKPIAGPEEMDRLTRRMAGVLPAAAHSPGEVRELLGAPRAVLRQVLYGRHLEQWHYDSPLSLCVVMEARKGQEARVQNVLLPGAAKP